MRPVFYSFRRCPYAMRARLAIVTSGLEIELREVVLRDKPREMLDISPKGTVPVLALGDGSILEESLDIMRHVLSLHDPAGWIRSSEATETDQLITANDGPFKFHLDRYKYPARYDLDATAALSHRAAGFDIIQNYEERLAHGGWLLGAAPRLADMAILPFIRQFAHIDRCWFEAQPIPHIRGWLRRFIESPVFIRIMYKYPKWEAGQEAQLFPAPQPEP